MLRALRLNVTGQWEGLDCSRKPALRRSDQAGFLLTTDALTVLAEADQARFLHRLNAFGWRTQQKGGWLWLDAPVPVPEECPDAFEGEAGCCVSILRRHERAKNAVCDEETAEWIRCAAKASDAGKEPLERFFLKLHGTLAEKLRRGEKLPVALIPYLNAASKEVQSPC